MGAAGEPRSSDPKSDGCLPGQRHAGFNLGGREALRPARRLPARRLTEQVALDAVDDREDDLVTNTGRGSDLLDAVTVWI